uniref:Uncharacterized protein n=1 Tax=Anopheles farauti TaxID=69004 RepID=A0A182QC17_9DIPT
MYECSTGSNGGGQAPYLPAPPTLGAGLFPSSGVSGPARPFGSHGAPYYPPSGPPPYSPYYPHNGGMGPPMYPYGPMGPSAPVAPFPGGMGFGVYPYNTDPDTVSPEGED